MPGGIVLHGPSTYRAAAIRAVPRNRLRRAVGNAPGKGVAGRAKRASLGAR